MRRVAPVVALVLAATPVAPARASDPTGFLCAADKTASPPGRGRLDGGPLVAAAAADGAPPADPLTITLRCSLQTDAYGTSSGPDFAETSGTGTGVAIAPPVEFAIPPDEIAYVCTEVTLTDRAGTVRHRYWDENLYDFTDDPDAACGLVYFYPCGGYGTTCEDYVGPLLDAVVCPALAPLYPPDGDVPDVWGCPPA
jgi:hypothetical protein